MDAPKSIVTVDDYEPLARQALPQDVYDFIAGGAGDERTLRENRAAFDRWVLRPRVLVGAIERDLTAQLLGTPVSFPVMVAPWAFQELAHPDGEPATARAAHRAGTIMVVSSATVDFLEDVAAASPGPKWWQLYIFEDRGFTAEMLRRVQAAGFLALAITVDVPALGPRHRDARSGFVLPLGVPGTEQVFDPSITWSDLAWVRERSDLPLLLKGILTAEDARLAIDAGVDGIIVSNHGGRQLDGAAAAIDALVEVVEAVAGRVPVLVDGGIRRGNDIVKALALGAKAVLVGRPAAWGLAAAGEEGVLDVLEILRRELDLAMALCGCRSIEEITPALVARR